MVGGGEPPADKMVVVGTSTSRNSGRRDKGKTTSSISDRNGKASTTCSRSRGRVRHWTMTWEGTVTSSISGFGEEHDDRQGIG